jgi:MFS superfamily sulfate permease-like transporter
LGAYRPFVLTVLSTLSTYAAFSVDRRRVGFGGSLFVRRPNAAQLTGCTTAVVVLAAGVAGPGFNAIHGAFEALGIFLERIPGILVTITFALATGVLFIAVSGFRLGEAAGMRPLRVTA